MPAHPEFNLGLRPSSQSGDAGRVTSIPATQRMKACAPSRVCGLDSRHHKRMSRFTLRGKTKVAHAVAAVLPGAQHREDRNQGDAPRLNGPGHSPRDAGAQTSAH